MSDFSWSAMPARPRSTTLAAQCRRLRWTMTICLALGLAGGAGVFALSWVTGMPAENLTDEPASVTQTQFYIGILATLEALLWVSAAAICLFGAGVMRRLGRRGAEARFLLWSAALSLLLTFDDILMLHDRVLPRHLSIPEEFFYVALALLVAQYLYAFRRTIRRTDYVLLILALAFLCTAAVAKAILPDRGLGLFFQDGFKFIGVVFWPAYYASATAELAFGSPMADGVTGDDERANSSDIN